ncbi:uncharacterized protein [Rutidosis leptorrhynchoides]|uniref:uncharacterized protein n=1 Tax=Rutidosis leptorrhynchoides TaxID=125765 RepID=UPI003A99CFD8
MGFRKWVAGFLGFGNHDENDNTENDNHKTRNMNSDEEIHHHHHNHPHSYSNRRGFSVQVPVDKVHQIGPVLFPCVAGDGGIQGLGWYTKRLRVDEDGDVADEFLDEVFSETSASNITEVHHKQFPKFEVKVNTKSAKARNPILSREGTIQQFVEYRGRFLLA